MYGSEQSQKLADCSCLVTTPSAGRSVGGGIQDSGEGSSRAGPRGPRLGAQIAVRILHRCRGTRGGRRRGRGSRGITVASETRIRGRGPGRPPSMVGVEIFRGGLGAIAVTRRSAVPPALRMFSARTTVIFTSRCRRFCLPLLLSDQNSSNEICEGIAAGEEGRGQAPANVRRGGHVNLYLLDMLPFAIRCFRV